MRMPELQDLDQDQRNIYTRAPTTGPLLVTGPPGTGKTILAFHRAARISGDGTHVQIIMFNNVLSRFSSNTDDFDFGNIGISTMHSWVTRWFRGAMGSYPPKLDRFKFDWRKMQEMIEQTSDDGILRKLDWGHLVIDEGQDFPPDMYMTLISTSRKLSEAGIEGAAISVFADENQAITEERSSVEQIRLNLNIRHGQGRFWHIHKNYRNNKEIATFARHFQVKGAQSAKLPDDNESGVMPTVMVVKPGKGALNTIKQLVINRPVEVGVIVLGNTRDVENIYTSIKNRLKGSNVLLQGYLGNPSKKLEELKNHMSLKFDTRPSITVLHKASCKGLEFDTVFVLHAEKLSPQATMELQHLRDLYVTSSRAREELRICFGTPEGGPLPAAIGLMPSPKKEICEYKGDSTTNDKLSHWLNTFNGWRDFEQRNRKKVEQFFLDPIHEEIFTEIGVSAVKEVLSGYCNESFQDHVEQYDGSRESLAWIIIETHLHNEIDEIVSQIRNLLD